MNDKKILFVRSGGGMPGLDIHVGIWSALEFAGIHATAVSGTSAGAVISAFDASGWGASSAAEFLCAHDDESIRHVRTGWYFRLPWINSIHDNDRIRVVLEGALPREWRLYNKPMQLWACKKRNAELSNVARPEITRDPIEAVMASMAICGFFPGIQMLDGETYIDGGPRFNLPLPADWTDYDEVYLLIGQLRPNDYAGDDVVSNLVRNINIAMQDQILDILDQTRGDRRVKVIWPVLPGNPGMLHFDHSLISKSFDWTMRKLNNPTMEERHEC